MEIYHILLFLRGFPWKIHCKIYYYSKTNWISLKQSDMWKLNTPKMFLKNIFFTKILIYIYTLTMAEIAYVFRPFCSVKRYLWYEDLNREIEVVQNATKNVKKKQWCNIIKNYKFFFYHCLNVFKVFMKLAPCPGHKAKS